MNIRTRYVAAFGLTLLGLGFAAGTIWQPTTVQAQSGGKVFELRTYTTNDGKLPNLEARFRDHTRRIFEKHGMENVGYWVPQEMPNTLIYIISHDSRQAATDSWASFRADPEWTEVARASQVDGQILAKAPDFIFMNATDYSPIQ